MRHYEIIFLVHPDQSDQLLAMVERYRSIAEVDGGKVHRFEDWGVRKLAYPICQSYKAHYALLNIECDQKALTEICDAFRFNDAVIRNMIIKRDKAITEVSPIMAAKHENASGTEDAEKQSKPKEET